MKISVVIPVYNAERFLRATLDSVLSQTFAAWECVCVNDGSTDGSGAILEAYAAKDSRFRVVTKENGGEGSARNAGLDAATGDYVSFLDADDTYHPGSLELIAAVIAKTGAEVLRFGWRSVTAHVRESEALPGVECASAIDISTRTESVVRLCTLGAATVISRKVCGDIRFMKLTQGADLVFVADCLLRTKKAVFIDAPILNYLTHDASISHRISTGLIIGTCRYIPELVERYARLGESPAAHRDTVSFMSELLLRRVFGSWKLFENSQESAAVRAEFWSALRRLATREDFFCGLTRRVVLSACRRQSDHMLKLFVLLPHRLKRKFTR